PGWQALAGVPAGDQRSQLGQARPRLAVFEQQARRVRQRGPDGFGVGVEWRCGAGGAPIPEAAGAVHGKRRGTAAERTGAPGAARGAEAGVGGDEGATADAELQRQVPFGGEAVRRVDPPVEHGVPDALRQRLAERGRESAPLPAEHWSTIARLDHYRVAVPG